MTINSRQKGAAGERELAALLRFHGYEARRGQQFNGGSESPDVVCQPLKDFHFECKRVEAGNLYKWMRQASRDASAGGKVPVVMHRRSREDWVAILPAGLFLQLLHKAGYQTDDSSTHD
jgi:Holliday junction resolvase